MIPKGSPCSGCPAYGLSPSYVPDEVKPGSPIYLLNQNPGADEEAIGIPMVGKTGQAWENNFLGHAHLTREDVSIGNAIRCRWGRSNDLPPVSTTMVKDAIAHCQRAYFHPPEGTKLFIAAGDYASYALTGTTIADGDKAGSGWRGYLRPYDPLGKQLKTQPNLSKTLWMPQDSLRLPVLSTWHIARTFHQPWWTLPTMMDWAKIPRILNGSWPKKPPTFAPKAPNPWPSMFTFDTEYDRETKILKRYSMCWGLEDDQTCVIEAADHTMPAWWTGSQVVVQYAPADLQHLARLTGTRWQDDLWTKFLIEDIPWKHAVLWSDHQHDLNYLGSIYGSFNRWKHLGESNPTLYAGLDATGLFEINRALEAELDRDPISRKVWETIDRPALRVFVSAQYRGIRVNSDRVTEATGLLEREREEATLKAQAVVGWPINLGSNPQTERQLYKIEGVKEPR